MSTSTIPAHELAEIRRTRRRPRRTQFDYLHIRRLLRDVRHALANLDGEDVADVLDVYCGSRPYDDLFPPGARILGLDVVANPYGVADVVTDEFLPFEDASFDLVTCFEAFHYVEDPPHGVAEMRRVLRPGGIALVTVPLVWEYDRRILEHRYTGPQLAALFAGWDDVQVVENGGRAVVWTTLTGIMLESVRARIPHALGVGQLVRGGLVAGFVALNLLGAALERLEERRGDSPLTLPMNLLLTARRPVAG